MMQSAALIFRDVTRFILNNKGCYRHTLKASRVVPAKPDTRAKGTCRVDDTTLVGSTATCQ